jgi:RNA polymerase sigma factor (sigma-70 family)
MVFGVCRRVLGNHHDAEDAFQGTFLILARKASTVRPRERVANWLHGVAVRTALKVRATTMKRRREQQVAEFPEREAAMTAQRLDLQPLLDQELSGLPENYRLPILLCDLEGRTIKDATRQLGWPQGTLACRLVRGRKLLAKRLASRGLVPSAGSLAVLTSQNNVSAAVPTSLLVSTITAASRIAEGPTMVAGVVPAKVAALMQGVEKAMLFSRLKTAGLRVLIVTLSVCAAATIYTTQAAEQPKAEQKPVTTDEVRKARAAPAPKSAAPREYVVTSRLLGAGAGQPKELLLLPKVTLDDGQLVSVAIVDVPEQLPANLLPKVLHEEKIKIGLFLDVRVRRREGNKIRLVLSVQKNEVDESGAGAVYVSGNSVQAVQDGELLKPVKLVVEREGGGTAKRWVEVTVDEVKATEKATPIPSVEGPNEKHSSAPSVLTPSNYRQKFDDVEETSRTKPATLRTAAIEQILGPGETITGRHPDLVSGPAGVGRGVQTWSRWECGGEALLVGYVDDTASVVVRLRR